MRKLIMLLAAMCGLVAANAQSPGEDSSALNLDSFEVYLDSVEKTFTYQHGTIKLGENIGTLQVPAGYKYLDAVQAERALTEVWGNPEGQATLGLLLPENIGVTTVGSHVFNIEYEEIGYVKDDDADDIDYKELLEEMQKDAVTENEERQKEGYESIAIVGWAAEPHYDAEKKVLHWAKEIKFGDAESNTLNYNVRILGRKGVLILNAISDISVLPEVNKNIPKVLNSFTFADGNTYADFNPDVDQVAAWTIGGLVAGKVLAKVGFFALLIKFWKVIALAVAGGATALWKRFRRKKEDGTDVAEDETPATNAIEETNATTEITAETTPEPDHKNPEA